MEIVYADDIDYDNITSTLYALNYLMSEIFGFKKNTK